MPTATTHHDGTPALDDPTASSPPRYWWLKRILVAYAIWALAMVAIWFWWDHTARTRLNNTLAAYKAAGQRVYIEDFQPLYIPDEENAAVGLVAAYEAITTPYEYSRQLPYNDYWIDDWHETPTLLLDQLPDGTTWVSRHSQVIENYLIGTSRARLDWGHQIRTPVMEATLQHVNGQRWLAKLIRSIAIARGSDAESTLPLQLAEALISHSNLLATRVAAAVETRHAIEVRGRASDLIESLPGLGTNILRDDTANKNLIHHLLSSSNMQTLVPQAFEAERMMIVDTMTNAIGQEISAQQNRTSANGEISIIARVIQPIFTLDANVTIQHFDRLMEEAASGIYVKSRIPAWPANEGLDKVLRNLSDLLWGKSDELIRLAAEADARSLMAAITIGLRMYQRDFGTLPNSLDVLIPHYLPYLPVDPFNPTGETFGFIHATQRPWLYSLGADNIDMSSKALAPTPFYTDDDILFFVDGKPE